MSLTASGHKFISSSNTNSLGSILATIFRALKETICRTPTSAYHGEPPERCNAHGTARSRPEYCRSPAVSEAQRAVVDEDGVRWMILQADVVPWNGTFPNMTTLDTEAGPLTIIRATFADFNEALRILREAADWLSARGNPQWEHWHGEVGELILRERIEHHEVYLGLSS
jgi:hypothetical protein